jgi:glycine oxidase
MFLSLMSAIHNIVIVGGGVIGLSIARALALRGVQDICLIERAVPGSEASFAAGGMLAPQAEADRRDEFFDLCSKSRDLYPDFAAALYEETGVDMQLDRTGTLYVALTEHDQRDIDKRFAWQSKADLQVERLTPTEALQLEPAISPNLTGALRFPLDYQVDNRQLVAALVRSVTKLGVRIMNATVSSVVTSNQTVTGVETSAGFIGGAVVILAAGSWTTQINGPLVPIEPVRGQMICFNAQPQLCRHVIYSPRGYLIPRHDGRLIAGSTTEYVGFTKQVTAGGTYQILRNALEISPNVANLPLVDSWSGLRPKAPDGLPVLGPCVEIDQLFYATGHYRNGILLAPITGDLIAEAVVNRKIASELEYFGAARFELVQAN